MKMLQKTLVFLAVLLCFTTLFSVVAATPVVMGDANGDGEIDICDVVRLAKSDLFLKQADYDFNGTNDDTDLAALRCAVLLDVRAMELSIDAAELD